MMGRYTVELDGKDIVDNKTIKVTYAGVTMDIPIEEAERAEGMMFETIAKIDHELGAMRNE